MLYKTVQKEQIRARDQKGNDVVSGIYFYQLKTGEFRQTKKMVLIR
ncbi:MAG: hypothetical protein GTO24_12820 [candidate division Zixibacteria bacterium]|nr:hypothetical protein [candidate division Zixibacteria bacterium]